LTRLLLIEALTLAAAALAVGLGGGWLVRRELLPLDRLARTAREVASLPLTRGSQRLEQRVPAEAPGTEIGDVTEAFNDMLDHLDLSLEERAETERQLRQLVADASHELRTPLTSIKGYAELYRRRDVSEDDRQVALRRIEAEADRMQTLVEDLLLLARLDQGRPLLEDDVDVCVLVAEICHDFSLTAHGHPISVDLPEGPAIVVGDEGRLRQVVSNLLANAVQHTPASTPIEVSVAKQTDSVLLTVTDQGPGMPSDFQPHAFDRFSRADVSRTRASGGSGLGLAIVAAVVAAHGGKVQLTSSSSGTAVAVTLRRPS
jgi:two-component system OmpR family sensor kinase